MKIATVLLLLLLLLWLLLLFLLLFKIMVMTTMTMILLIRQIRPSKRITKINDAHTEFEEYYDDKNVGAE